MRHNPLADSVWRDLSHFVRDSKDGWDKVVMQQTGLPFSRIRILRRLARAPLTVKQLAEAASVDAPAATVAVNDLEERGLVIREIDPDNRRSKLVSLTDSGRAMLARVDAVDDPAPESLAALDERGLNALRDILARMAQG